MNAKKKKKRVLAWVSPTLFGASIVDEVLDKVCPITLADFRSLAQNQTPKIWSREKLQSYPVLWTALSSLWSKLPAYLVVIPVTHLSPPTVALLGIHNPISFKQLKEIATLLTKQANARREPITRAWAKTQDIFDLHPTPTIIADRKSGAIFCNLAARRLLLKDNILDLELLLGADAFRMLHRNITSKELLLKFTFPVPPNKTLHIDANTHLNDKYLLFLLESHGFESPRKKSSHPESSGAIPRLTSVMMASMSGPKRGVAGTTLFWLCSDQLEPVPLGTSYSLTVGRHESNDLVLPDNEVSRFHATFKVRGTTVNIEDLGSSNGVKINGERRAQHRLSVGDEIQIGPYVFRVESPKEAPKQESKANTSAAIPPNTYSGDLSEISLRDALRSLQLQQKTGTLTLLQGSIAGHITLLAGRIHSSELGVLLGKEAVEVMMTYNEGHFIFRHEKAREDTGLDLSVSDIIKEVDEQDFENTGALLPGSSGHDIKP